MIQLRIPLVGQYDTRTEIMAHKEPLYGRKFPLFHNCDQFSTLTQGEVRSRGVLDGARLWLVPAESRARFVHIFLLIDADNICASILNLRLAGVT